MFTERPKIGTKVIKGPKWDYIYLAEDSTYGVVSSHPPNPEAVFVRWEKGENYCSIWVNGEIIPYIEDTQQTLKTNTMVKVTRQFLKEAHQALIVGGSKDAYGWRNSIEELCKNQPFEDNISIDDSMIKVALKEPDTIICKEWKNKLSEMFPHLVSSKREDLEKELNGIYKIKHCSEPIVVLDNLNILIPVPAANDTWAFSALAIIEPICIAYRYYPIFKEELREGKLHGTYYIELQKRN